jgi:hypothetical protein
MRVSLIYLICFLEENLTNRSFLPTCNSADVVTGNQDDVVRVSRQLLNRGNAHRTISKQECMVEQADMPLVLCTEVTETINLSGSYKLTGGHEVYLKKYRQRAPNEPKLSLHQHVTEMLSANKDRSGKSKIIIPHYVGASGQPRYPPTKEYAMATLLVHKPWRAPAPPTRTDEEMLTEFMEFVESPECPKQVQMEYARVKERYLSKRPPEAVASEECYDREIQPDIDDDTRDILGIVTNVTRSTDPFLSVDEFSFDRGLNYDWLHRNFPVRNGLGLPDSFRYILT